MKTCSILAFLLASLPLLAQDMPKPTAEHQKLAACAGTWDAVLATTGPDGKAVQANGVSVMKMSLGGFWLVDDYSMAEFMGGPFQGHGITGYDPTKGKYVTTWVDSMTPSMLVMEGNYDKDGKVLTMTGTGIGMDNKPAKYRNVSTWKSADTMVFEMFITGTDGKETSVMTITYTRRGAKAEDAKAPKK